jgi:hypothetical protein
MSEEHKEDSGVGEVPGKPGRKKTPSGLQRALGNGSRFQRNAHWVALLGGLIPAVTASVISVMTAYRGEPEANRAYEILAPQVNNQKTSLQIILSRLAKIEGHYEGVEVGKLQAKIDTLVRENAAMKARLVGSSPPPAVKKVEPRPGASAPKCKEGQVAGDDKKCHWVKRTVAAKVKATEAQTKEYERKLREKQEWLRREKAKRRLLEQKVRMLKQRPMPKPAPPALKAVPKSLKAAGE